LNLHVSVLGSIIRASTTVKTLTVRYVTDCYAFSDVDGQIGQGSIARLKGGKYLKRLDHEGVALTVFARCLIPA
jgi:hypothetical protein